MKKVQILIIHFFLLLGYFTYVGAHEFLHHQQIGHQHSDHCELGHEEINSHCQHDQFHVVSSLQRHHCACDDLQISAYRYISQHSFVLTKTKPFMMPIDLTNVIGAHTYFSKTIRLIV